MLLLPLVAVGCKREAPPSPSHEPAQTIQLPSAPPPTPLTEDSATEIGRRAANGVLIGLMARVKKEMQEGGPEKAIDFCSEAALPLTAEIGTAQAHPVSIKRTSSRLRNPKNAPDELERQALSYFESSLGEPGADKARPSKLVQKVDGGYRYYQPITMLSACLACHGERDSINSKVLSKLAERYPNDQALGYKEGDFRGVIRVSVLDVAQ